MKAIKCELCGSNDVVKQDGLFVCQHCGTKYSTEEAKKLMLDGTVNVQGTVRIDDTYELKNLYENARWAKSTNDCESAKKYYGKIVEKDPNSWEAQFYSLYFKVKTCRDNERIAFVEVIRNCLMPVMELVRDNVPKEQEQNYKFVLNKFINSLQEDEY